jgi:hypothetical protein
MRHQAIYVILLLLMIPFAAADGLDISDIDVDVNGDSEDDVDKNGGAFEAAPGDRIDITIEVENTFDVDTVGHEIKSIDVDIDVGPFCPDHLDDDIEEDASLGRLDPGTDDSVTFRFTIPECAEEDNYDFDILVKGKDSDDGTEYRVTETIILQVDKNPTEITLEFDAFEPSIVRCDARTIETDIEVHNIGSLSEDAGLLIINNEIGINRFEFLDLESGDYDDEDTYFIETFTFTIDENIEPGEYEVRAEVEYDGNRREEKRYQTITIEACEDSDDEESSEDNEEENDDVIVITTGTETDEDTTSVTVTEIEVPEVDTSAKTFYSVPLLVGAIVVAILILLLMMFLLKKK